MAAALGGVGGRHRGLPRRRRGQHDAGLRHRAARAAADHRPRRPRQGLLHPAAARRPDRRRAGHRAGGPPRARAAVPRALRGCASRWPARRRRTAGSSRSSASPTGYGVELGLLIDVAQSLGPDRLAQVDLGERIHRNRPLHELRPQAVDVLRAALERVAPASLPRRTLRRLRERHHRRLQPGPLTFRTEPDGALVPGARPAGGWPPRCTGSSRAAARRGPR